MDEFELRGSEVLTQTTSRRTFTLEEANRALPLVRRIVSDIVTQFDGLVAMENRRAALAQDNGTEDIAKLDEQAAESAEALNVLIAELNSIGCQLKDPKIGLVDFPSNLDGREIFLCWKFGEDRVAFWHETYAGVAGRQPATLST